MCYKWGFANRSVGKESACNAGFPGLIPGLGRSPGERKGYPLQYSGLENPHGQRSLVGYSPWGCKESDTTEWLSTWQKPTQHCKAIILQFKKKRKKRGWWSRVREGSHTVGTNRDKVSVFNTKVTEGFPDKVVLEQNFEGDGVSHVTVC